MVNFSLKFFLILTFLKKYNKIFIIIFFFILVIIYLKIILKEFLDLINLFKIKIFYIYKLIKVIIIYKNNNFILIIFKLIILVFKSFNNC